MKRALPDGPSCRSRKAMQGTEPMEVELLLRLELRCIARGTGFLSFSDDVLDSDPRCGLARRRFSGGSQPTVWSLLAQGLRFCPKVGVLPGGCGGPDLGVLRACVAISHGGVLGRPISAGRR